MTPNKAKALLEVTEAFVDWDGVAIPKGTIADEIVPWGGQEESSFGI